MANRIYVASSWQHTRHHVAVEAARRAGLDVYDYRHPAFVPAEPFAWSSVTCELTVATAAKHLADKRAREQFHRDRLAMEWADACLLLLPAGLSAHLEAGWFAGRGRPVAIVALGDDTFRPELMYHLFDQNGLTPPIFSDADQACAWLRDQARGVSWVVQEWDEGFRQGMALAASVIRDIGDVSPGYRKPAKNWARNAARKIETLVAAPVWCARPPDDDELIEAVEMGAAAAWESADEAIRVLHQALMDADGPMCAVCACTQNLACEGGCGWAEWPAFTDTLDEEGQRIFQRHIVSDVLCTACADELGKASDVASAVGVISYLRRRKFGTEAEPQTDGAREVLGPPIVGGHGGREAADHPACGRCGRALGYHPDDLGAVCASCEDEP